MNFHFKKSHLIANLISFSITGASGLFLNILIVRLYNTDTLGLFNQILAIYFILSQLTTFGIHLSVLAYMPVSEQKHSIFLSAMFTVAIIATLISLISYLVLYPGLSILNFLDLRKSLYLIMPALIFFSLNKVMIFTLNGLGHFNKFAVANGLRLFLMLIGLYIHYFFSFAIYNIALIILFAEFFLFVFLIYCHTEYISKSNYAEIYTWAKKHLHFGKFALFSGLIIDLNTKVDIMMLSFFVTRPEIGIYSFATMLGEGFYQLIYMFKNLNAKNLSEHLYSQKKKELKYTKQDMKKIIFFVYLIGIISIGAFQTFTCFVTKDPMVSKNGFWIYAIYSLCLVISAKYLLLDNILLQLKKPKLDNYVRLLSLLANAFLCLVLIPIFSIYGAALALGISIIINSLAIRYFIMKLQINI